MLDFVESGVTAIDTSEVAAVDVWEKFELSQICRRVGGDVVEGNARGGERDYLHRDFLASKLPSLHFLPASIHNRAH